MSEQSAELKKQESDPGSAYVHIPFCRHRCGYCNFSVVAGRDHLVQRFLDGLEFEIGGLDQKFELDTLFFGGGTPSHLSPENLDRLREIIESRFTFSSSIEVTAECNPNDLNETRGRALARLGVNRISLGAQSFQPDKLKRLERDHLSIDIEKAVKVARTFCRSVSIDLIFAAPNETLDQWKSDIDQALELEPDHISTYELTYEKGTQFWNRLNHGTLKEATEDVRSDMYLLAIERIESAGLKQYEVSSFAKSGHRCLHNQRYWTGDQYFAFGPGASSFLGGVRKTNHQSTMTWLKRVEAGVSPTSEFERLNPLAAAKEQLAIGLRMIDGIDETDFENRTGHSVVSIFGDLANQLIENQLLINEGSQWRLTPKGIMVSDWISCEIVE